MTDSRSPYTQKGAAPGSLAAVIVGGILVLAIGFVLGRYAGDTPAPEPVEGGGENPAAPTASGGPAAEPVAVDPAGQEPIPYEFDPPMLDFGIVAPNIELRGTVKIKNLGDRALVIRELKPDCKCTVFNDMAGATIPPGEYIEMETLVEARSYPGEKTSKVGVVFENAEPAIYDIHSVVSRAVRTDPAYLAAIDVQRGRVVVESLEGETFRVIAANDDPPVYADGFNPDLDEPRNSYELIWDLTDYNEVTCEDSRGRKMPFWWVIETDHPETPLLDLRVRHLPCTSPEGPKEGQLWVLSDFRAVLDRIVAGESGEFEVFVKWPFPDTRPNDTIQRVKSESEDFHATLMELTTRNGKTYCRIRITPRPEFRGLLYGVVRVYATRAAHSMPVTVIAVVVDPEEAAVEQ